MLTCSLTVISRKRTVRIKSSYHTCSIESIMHNNVLVSFNYVLCSPLEYLVYKNTGIIFSTFILQKGIPHCL